LPIAALKTRKPAGEAAVTTYVLDSSAVLRMLDKEAGWERVAAILDSYWNRMCEVEISAVQWGEIAGSVRKRAGVTEQNRAMQKLGELQFRIAEANSDRAVRAAELKADRKISYADAFALELAIQSPNSVLVTADFDFKKVDDMTRIEFLSNK
jgi:PIN domain nuclease of toxin-antitoxin system